MDHKVLTANHKRANKLLQHPNNNKTKKKAPLKVVYITNPIKFKATASEFRALVQELTGQDSNEPAEEVSKVVVAEEEDQSFADRAEEEGMKEGLNGSNPLGSRTLYDDNVNDDHHDGFCGVDSFQGLMASSSFWNQGDHDLYDEFKSQYIYGCNVN